MDERGRPENAFVVLQPGPLTTIQDLGRPGWGAYGVPEGGALDREGLRRANALVGNRPRTPAIEFSYRGPTLRWRGARPIATAVIGDEESLRIVHPQEEMYAGFLTTRSHGYLAVPGGFAAERIMGGQGTCLAGGFGGFHGRVLKAADVVDVARPPRAARPRAPVALYREEEPATATLRVLAVGFAERALKQLTTPTWRVEAGDRVGVSLAGPAMQLARLPLSQPACPGCIQVSGSGRPILLLRDHPTVGGYPVVAVVAQADLDSAGQLRQGQAVRFELIEEPEALRLLRAPSAVPARAPAASPPSAPSPEPLRRS